MAQVALLRTWVRLPVGAKFRLRLKKSLSLAREASVREVFSAGKLKQLPLSEIRWGCHTPLLEFFSDKNNGGTKGISPVDESQGTCKIGLPSSQH